MSKTILSLDQSSRTTGYAVFVDGKLSVFDKFTFNDADMGVRLVNIKNKIKELIDLYHPDEIAYEDIQQQSNVQTFKILAEVFGVLAVLFTELNIPHTAVPSSSWKSTLRIKGNSRPEQKKNAQQYVIDRYKVKPTQDECDAICIGVHYINNSINDWTK